MDQPNTESSPSPAESLPVQKRRRQSERINSSTLNIPATISVRPELGRPPPSEDIIDINLSIDTRLDEIRKQKDDLAKEERQLLEKQESVSKQTIKELKSRLSEAMKTTQEALRAQASAESQLSRQKTEMQQKITELLNKNVELEELLAQRTAEGTTKLNAAANRITELQQKFLDASSPSQRDIFLKTTELQEAKLIIQELETEKISLRREIQDLRPKAAYADELEKELTYANELISNLRGNDLHNGIPEDESSFHRVEVEDGNNVDDDAMDITDEKLALGVQQDGQMHENSGLRGPIVNGMTRVVPEHVMVELLSDFRPNESSSTEYKEGLPIEVSDGEESSSSLQFYEYDGSAPQEDHRIWVGQHYLLPSDVKFFEIDWRTHYVRHGRGFACNSCPHKVLARGQIEDHVWTAHYGGVLLCPLCPASTFTTKLRYTIKKHMREKHLSK